MCEQSCEVPSCGGCRMDACGEDSPDNGDNVCMYRLQVPFFARVAVRLFLEVVGRFPNCP